MRDKKQKTEPRSEKERKESTAADFFQSSPFFFFRTQRIIHFSKIAQSKQMNSKQPGIGLLIAVDMQRNTEQNRKIPSQFKRVCYVESPVEAERSSLLSFFPYLVSFLPCSLSAYFIFLSLPLFPGLPFVSFFFATQRK